LVAVAFRAGAADGDGIGEDFGGAIPPAGADNEQGAEFSPVTVNFAIALRLDDVALLVLPNFPGFFGAAHLQVAVGEPILAVIVAESEAEVFAFLPGDAGRPGLFVGLDGFRPHS
jgi:hypothetical protein